jgi:hypothetical protein
MGDKMGEFLLSVGGGIEELSEVLELCYGRERMEVFV